VPASHEEENRAVSEFVVIIALGALAAIIILIVAPLWLVYLAAFFALTPVVATAIFFARGYLRAAGLSVRSVFRKNLQTNGS
jgi:uncharacterized membrane protein